MPNTHVEPAQVGKALRAARHHRKLTTREIERRTGINNAHIARIENGVVGMTISTFLRLSNAVETEPWKVLRFAGTLDQEGGN